MLIGGRTSLAVGFAATLASVAIGVTWGGVAGLLGGAADEALMRIVDFLYGIPYMFLVVLVMLLFADTARGQALPVFVALGLVQWLTMARIVRGQVLALRRAATSCWRRGPRVPGARASCSATCCRTVSGPSWSTPR